MDSEVPGTSSKGRLRKMTRRPKAISLKAATVGRLENQGLSHQVVARVLELVRTGSLSAGDRLPPERELIEIFGISRPSLREALRALSLLGVVEARHGGGVFVTDLDARTLLAPLDFYLSLTNANFADAFDSRRVIEIEIVRRAAEKATEIDIKDLNEIISVHKTVQDDLLAFRILDVRFHEKLSTIAGNAVLQRIAYALYNLGLDFQNFDRRARTDPNLIAQSTADHAAIVAAIAEHDAEGAASAMATHIQNIESSTRRVVTSEATESPAPDRAPAGRNP